MDLQPPSFCLNSNSEMAASFDEWFRPKVDSLSGIVDLDSVMMKTGSIVGSGSVGGVDVLDHAAQNLAEFEGFLLTERDHRSSTGIVETGEASASHQLDDLDNSDLLLQDKEHDIQGNKVCCDGNSNKLNFIDESLELPREILTIKEQKIESVSGSGLCMEPLQKKDFPEKECSKTCDEEDLCSFSMLNYHIEPSMSSLEEPFVSSETLSSLKDSVDSNSDVIKCDESTNKVDKGKKCNASVCKPEFSHEQSISKVRIPSDGSLVMSRNSVVEDAQVVIRNVTGEPLFQGKISELISAAASASSDSIPCLGNSLVQSSCVNSRTTATLKIPVKICPPGAVQVLSSSDRITSHDVNFTKSENAKVHNKPYASVKLKVGANPPEEADLEMAEEQDVEDEFIDSINNSKGLRRVTEDGPVTEALAELGITNESMLCTISGVSGNAGGKLWVCHAEGCNKSFPRLSMLKIHILGHYGVRPYKCDYDGCHWSFYTYFKLKRHKETHLKKKDYLCPVDGCGRRFTTIYNLHTHEKLHWRPAEMLCPVKSCGACFQTRRHLEVHLRDHGAHHAPYRCPYADCGKHYYSANSLQSHVKSHQHKEEEVRCSWEGCGKLFDKPCRLRAHMRTHTGDKPYPCLFQGCGARFSTASKLKRHQHKHTNNRKFKCGEEGCMKSFLRSEHLKEHLLKHAGVGSFHCPIPNCKVKFTAKSSLYVHLKKHKGGMQSVQSSPSDTVTHHMQTVYSEKEKPTMWQCPAEGCIRKYVNKSSLRQHLLKMHVLVLEDGHPMMLMTNSVDDIGIAADPVEENNSTQDLRNTYIVMGLPSGLDEEVSVIGESSFVQTTVAPLNDMLPATTNDECANGIAEQMENQVSVASSVVGKEEVLSSSSDFMEPDGSARTKYTLNDILREREIRRKQYQVGDGSEGSKEGCDPIMEPGSAASILSVASKDMVLPQEPSPCVLLQDDLPGTLFRVSGASVDGPVDREGVMSDVDGLDVGGQSGGQLDPHQVLVPSVLGAGGFQVLLLSPHMQSPRTHDFPPESTINLRDLE